MKRSTLKRTKPPARGKSKLSRSARLKPIGKRGAADREAIEAVRAEVLARAGHRCERCGLSIEFVGRLHLHHRKTRAQGGGHEAENLSALCKACHAQIHAGSPDAAKWIETRRGAA